MNVSEIKGIVQRSLNIPTSDTTVGARVVDEINRVRRDLAKRTHWPFLQKTYLLPIVPDYTTGTVSITKDTVTVTGVDTVFADVMVGRYIGFGTNVSTEWYRISKVSSTTELTIDAPYQGGVDVSGSVFIIRKFYYRVPGDVRYIENIHDFAGGKPLIKEESATFAVKFPEYGIVGIRDHYTEFGRYARETTYSTGTITCATNSRTLIGDGSSWVANVLPGDNLTLGSYTYKIDTINNDTELMLATKVLNGATNLAYSVAHNIDSMMVRFAYPADSKNLVAIDYYKDVADFQNENDEDEFTRLHPNIVIDGLEVLEHQFAEDDRWKDHYQQWQINIREAIKVNDTQSIWAPNVNRYLPYD